MSRPEFTPEFTPEFNNDIIILARAQHYLFKVAKETKN